MFLNFPQSPMDENFLACFNLWNFGTEGERERKKEAMFCEDVPPAQIISILF